MLLYGYVAENAFKNIVNCPVYFYYIYILLWDSRLIE